MNIWGLSVLGSEQHCVPKAESHQLAHPELASFWHLRDRVLAHTSREDNQRVEGPDTVKAGGLRESPRGRDMRPQLQWTISGEGQRGQKRVGVYVQARRRGGGVVA